ncbi:MAG: hypothetical protein L6Q37_08140 [Bdellovibrionaceae bacterium]|nr:hypothetical protein [Pseudobdellovibrionaceae bacterium]NUM57070.1 hypothetical protein [Pseudobdellovibrionaceae bacterium]
MKLIFSCCIFLVFITLPTQAQSNSDDLETLSLPTETSSSDVSKTNVEAKKKTETGLKKEKESVGAVLDFEGEVIEGERRRPDLFLQISIDNVKFDSLIYNRDDFNDYLESDRKSRNKFFKMK